MDIGPNFGYALLAADVAVTIQQKSIILVERNIEPCCGKLVIPGGHVDRTDLSVAHAGARELFEEAGLIVKTDDLKFLMFLDAPDRDSRYRLVTIVFTVDLDADENRISKSLSPGTDASIVVIRNLCDIQEEELGFDHYLVIQKLRVMHGV